MTEQDRAKLLAKELHDRTPDEQVEEARRRCGDDHDFLAKVLAELDHTLSMEEHRALPSLMAGSPTLSPATGSPEEPKYDIGPCVGRGGFGVVHAAIQRFPVRREVALKILDDVRSAESILQRFAAEQQVLALLEHPSIARIYDAGVLPDGRPFFSMELVRGPEITRYCDDERLPLGPRLSLAVSVCEAVLHAHQRGVLHRDLKPSNVLVTEIDGQPLPKVIDFGIAGTVDGRLADTLRRDSGGFAGTPMYASPEQASPDAHLDVRSDVFALGLLLLELLVGVTPRDPSLVRDATANDLMRSIRTDPISDPASRFADQDAESQARIAHGRRTTTKSLERAFRGDLGHVLCRCVRLERGDRYQSVSDLLADLRRLLDGDVPLAAPRTIRRSVHIVRRRHPVLAPAAAGIALLLPLLVSGGFLREMRQRDAIVQEDRQAATEELEIITDRQAALETELDVLRGPFIETLRSAVEEDVGARVTEALIRQGELVRTEWSESLHPATSLEFLAADATAKQRLARSDEAAEAFAEAATLAASALGPRHPRTLELRVAELSALSEAGSLGDRIDELEGLIRIQSEALGPVADATLASRTVLAEAFRLRDAYERALAEHEAVLALRTRIGGDTDLARLASLNNVALSRRRLAERLIDTDRDRALASLEQSIAEFEEVIRIGRLDTERPTWRLVLNHGNLGDANAEIVRLVDQGRLQMAPEAVAAARATARERLEYAYGLAAKSLGPSHPQRRWATALLANYYATTEGWLSDRESRIGQGAIRLFEDLLVSYREAGLERSSEALRYQRDLGLSEILRGDLAAGRQEVREVIASGFDPDRFWVQTLVYLADAEIELGLAGDPGADEGATWTINEFRQRYGGVPTLRPIVLDLDLRRQELLGRPIGAYSALWESMCRDAGSSDIVAWALAQPPSNALRAARMLLATGSMDQAATLLTDPGLSAAVRSYLDDHARRDNELFARQHRQWDLLRIRLLVAQGEAASAIQAAGDLLDRQRREAPAAFAERSQILELLVRALPVDDPRRQLRAEDALDACRQAKLADGARPHPRLRWLREQQVR